MMKCFRSFGGLEEKSHSLLHNFWVLKVWRRRMIRMTKMHDEIFLKLSSQQKSFELVEVCGEEEGY
jgi:hypothetical protein